MDNADLLTAAASLLERYKEEEHELALEIQCLQARRACMQEVVASLSGRPRGRPRKSRKEHEQDATPESEAAPRDMFTALSS